MALVELDLDDVNGIELLKMVRCGRTSAPRALRMGMLAGFADENVLAAAVALDLNGLLLKPVSQSDLTRRVSRMISEDRPVKPIDDYLSVKTPESQAPVTEATDSERSPIAVIRPVAPRPRDAEPPARTPSDIDPDAKMFGPKLRRPLIEVDLGWQIAVDVNGLNGQCLIAAGTILNARALRRLRELADDGQLTNSEIWARKPLMAAERRSG